MAWTKTGNIKGTSGALLVRGLVTATTPSIAANGTDTSQSPSLGKAFLLYSIQSSRPARIQLYSTAAAMTSDASRAIGTDPSSDAGVILDFVTVDTNTHTLSPMVWGANQESTVTRAISMRVTNNGATGTVAVTFNAARAE